MTDVLFEWKTYYKQRLVSKIIDMIYSLQNKTILVTCYFLSEIYIRNSYLLK